MNLRCGLALILAGLTAPSQAARIHMAKVRAPAAGISAGLPASAVKLSGPSLALSAASLIPNTRFLLKPVLVQASPVGTPAAFDFEPGEYELFQDMAAEILQRFPPQRYYYVGVGRSPTVLLDILRALDPAIAGQLPAGKATHARAEYIVGESAQQMQAHLSRFLPDPEALGGRKLLLIDHVESGLGLKHVRELVARSWGEDRVESLALVCRKSPNSSMEHIKEQGHQELFYDPVAQLKRFASERYDRFSEYTPGTFYKPETLSAVTENPEHAALQSALAAAMARDSALGQIRAMLPKAPAPAQPKVLLLEALGAIGNTGHEGLVKKSLLSMMDGRKPEVLIQDLNLIFEQSPEAVTSFLKANDIGVINISAAMGTSAKQQSRWRDLPAPAPEDDPELKRGLELRDQAIKQWSAILSDPELDINLVVAAPNTPSRDGSYIKPFDIADRAPKYDHLAPFHPSEGTPFPSLDLDAEIPGAGQRYSDKVAIVGGIRTKWSGYGPAVRMFTSPYWHGDRGNSFAAPKIAGLLWRLRTELSLSAAEASRLLFEQLSQPYRYIRDGQEYSARKIILSPWKWLNRILSDRLLRRTTTRDRTSIGLGIQPGSAKT
ncbi:MAG: hypothetical protein WC881_03755 [Elusimicrobiota bacterium]|jgi:hypothetical protein